MKNKTIILIIVALLAAAPQLSFAQYFNVLYDFDSTVDIGLNVFPQSDSGGDYLIYGLAGSAIYNYNGLMWLTISEDGSTVDHRQWMDTSNISEWYEGSPGAIKQLPDGGYVIPLDLQTYYSADTLRSAVGIIRLNASLDTVFMKLYTDTSVFYDYVNDCALMPDGGFLLAGERGGNADDGIPPVLGLLIRTDSMGNTLWMHTYTYNPSINCYANTVEALDNGNILVGASYIIPFTAGGYDFDDYQPWFLELDSLGNILRDTLYGSRYGGGYIRTDANGGYYQMGDLDSFLSTDYESYDNFPGYIAHLDTNFRVQWFTLLGGVHDFYGLWEVRQLRDSDYLIVAENGDSIHNYTFSSLTKIGRSGNIVWHQEYEKDTIGSHARDAKELPNSNIVFTGYAFNTTEPGDFSADVWLVSVDSNGCEIPGCGGTTTTPQPLLKTGGVMVFPNPCYGDFSVRVSDAGVLSVYNIEGQEVAAYAVKEGETGLRLPWGLSPGVYLCKYLSAGNEPIVVRLLVQ